MADLHTWQVTWCVAKVTGASLIVEYVCEDTRFDVYADGWSDVEPTFPAIRKGSSCHSLRMCTAPRLGSNGKEREVKGLLLDMGYYEWTAADPALQMPGRPAPETMHYIHLMQVCMRGYDSMCKMVRSLQQGVLVHHAVGTCGVFDHGLLNLSLCSEWQGSTTATSPMPMQIVPISVAARVLLFAWPLQLSQAWEHVVPGFLDAPSARRVQLPGMRNLLDSAEAALSRPIVTVAFSCIEGYKEIQAYSTEVNLGHVLGLGTCPDQ